MHALIRTITVALAMSVAVAAHAGPYGDALGQCIQDSTTGKDRKELGRWFFVALAAHPDMKDVARVDTATRDRAMEEAGKLFTRLLADDCASQTRDATRNEGRQAVGKAFELLGRLAAQELIADPAVQANMGELERHVDMMRVESVMK